MDRQGSRVELAADLRPTNPVGPDLVNPIGDFLKIWVDLDHLVGMLRDRSPAIQSLAAHYVGELGLTNFRTEIETIDSHGTGLLTAVYQRAAALFAPPAQGLPSPS